MSTTTKKTKGPTQKQAEACLKAVLDKYAAYFEPGMGCSKPVLVEDFDDPESGGYLILWEEGPYEWPYSTVMGAHSEETALGIAEIFGEDAAKAYRKDPKEGVTWPKGVHVECATHYSISIWRA